MQGPVHAVNAINASVLAVRFEAVPPSAALMAWSRMPWRLQAGLMCPVISTVVPELLC